MAELASNKEWLEKIEKVTKECPKNALIFVDDDYAQRWDLLLCGIGSWIISPAKTKGDFIIVE